MDLTPVYVAVGAAAAGFLQGLSGFAFAVSASAVWAWLVVPQLAGPMVALGALIAQVLSLAAIRRAFDLKRLLPFVIAGLLGVPIGVVLLKNIDRTIFRLLVGAILFVYCAGTLLFANPRPLKSGGRLADAAVGLVGGVMGGVAGLSGPAPALWCALRGWKRDVQRAVSESFTLVIQLATLAVYAGSGLITGRSAWMLALVAPVTLIPALFGTRLRKRVNETVFNHLVLVCAGLSGLALIVAAAEQLARLNR
jgi:uncharacterized membrane protein YfcA